VRSAIAYRVPRKGEAAAGNERALPDGLILVVAQA
jgi:hypothetical protein